MVYSPAALAPPNDFKSHCSGSPAARKASASLSSNFFIATKLSIEPAFDRKVRPRLQKPPSHLSRKLVASGLTVRNDEIGKTQAKRL